MRNVLLSLAFFIAAIPIFGKPKHYAIDSLLKVYIQVGDDKNTDLSKEIASYAWKRDSSEVEEVYRIWISKAKDLDNRLYVQSLYYYSRQLLTFKNYSRFIENFDSGFSLAYKSKYKFEIGDFYALKSEYFYRIQQYDSLFVYVLKAEKYFEELEDKDKIVTCYTLLADAYYRLELFNEAEKYYRKIIELEGEPNYWHKFRKYTVLNNLALVKLNQDSLQQSLDLFQKALSLQHQLIKGDTNKVFLTRLAYSHLCLSKVYYRLDDFEKALKYFYISKASIEALQIEKDFDDYYIIGAEIFIRMNNLDSASIMLAKALQIFENSKNIKSLIKAYKILSELSLMQGQTQNFISYIKKAYSLDIERRKNLDKSRIIQIKAENDQNRFDEKLAIRAKQIDYMTISILLLVAIIIIIVILYLKILASHKKLVQKNVEITRSEQIINSLTISVETISDEDYKEFEHKDDEAHSEDIELKNEHLQELAIKINNLILNEKLFLNSNLTINDLSEKLKVNRTYISQAINQFSKEENFKSYLNSLRIKEALKLLSDDKNDIYTLEAIYEKSGFISRNTFNRAFQKHTGVTPSYYQKNRHEFE